VCLICSILSFSQKAKAELDPDQIMGSITMPSGKVCGAFLVNQNTAITATKCVQFSAQAENLKAHYSDPNTPYTSIELNRIGKSFENHLTAFRLHQSSGSTVQLIDDSTVSSLDYHKVLGYADKEGNRLKENLCQIEKIFREDNLNYFVSQCQRGEVLPGAGYFVYRNGRTLLAGIAVGKSENSKTKFLSLENIDFR
jgi:hypothetical protein